MYESGVNQETGFTMVNGVALGSQLSQMLMAPDIEPGSAPSYELAKLLYSFHPLGAILAEAPIKRAQGQARIVSCGVLGEDRIIRQYEEAWGTIGKIGATQIIGNLATLSRVYGIASIGVGEIGKDSGTKLELDGIDPSELYFNVLDPLNTAGSLVLNQDPNSPLFLKQGVTYVAGKKWHPSRTIAMLNEDPLYIEWSSSAFGFVGRSVYQRALYPLKTFLQTMITDQMVTQKAGLLVAKMQSPGSFVDNLIANAFKGKRGFLKSGVTGQVLSIGTEEEIETLNMMNLEGPARFARENCIKNIASAAGMPASIIAQETFTQGFGEGSEDAKKEASYLNDVRVQMKPAYAFMDAIVQRIAWTPEFYTSIQSDYPEYKGTPYQTALHTWMRAFSATWPNPLEEPESEKAKAADVQFKSVVALLETLLPTLDPQNSATLITWAANNVNERVELFASKLDIDEDALTDFLQKKATQAEALMSAGGEGEEEKEPSEPQAFSGRA